MLHKHDVCLRAVCALCRALRALLRLLGRGGTSLPGRLALRLYPDILERLSERADTVLVTGTNGKTTTCGFLRHMAERLGVACISNVGGANLLYGIASCFVCGKMSRRADERTAAIIECDEGNLPRAAQLLHPKVIVVTNLFRDQLDRYGELTQVRDKILAGIKNAPDARLCLNADCPLSASLAWETDNSALYFGLDVSGGRSAGVLAAPRCLSCGSEITYASRTYAHLGHWACPVCGRKRPLPQVVLSSAERSAAGGADVTAAVWGRRLQFHTALETEYNLYNAAAALAAAEACGWDICPAAASLEDADTPFGRGESLRVGSKEVCLFLAKNPAGMDRLLEQLSPQAGEFYPVFCLNDNYADGRDVSWIWDCDFEAFTASGAVAAGVWGLRRRDMLLRLKYSSRDKDGVRIQEYQSLKALKRRVAASELPVCVIANYTAMLAVRKALAGRALGV